MAGKDLKVVTYNLHGFNQGLPYLQDLLLVNDIVCVQEHWLGSNDERKLNNINNDFTVIASYAIDAVLGERVLRGRSFGGLALFVRSSMIKTLEIICLSDRFIIVKFNNFLLINVYMPCNNRELFTCTLGAINDFICKHVNEVDHCIVNGDFNFTFVQNDPLWEVFDCFLTSCKLFSTYECITDSPGYTYIHQSLNRKSVIDYIFVTRSLYNSILKVTIQDSGLNLSDHIPVTASFNVNFDKAYGLSLPKKFKEAHNEKILRWDKADLSLYYECTYIHIYPIYQELLYVSGLNYVSNFSYVINHLYRKLIDALLTSDVVIPRVHSTFFKHWWSHSLDEFKKKSIDSHQLWMAAGNPNEGEIYQKMKKAKMNYKQELSKCREEKESDFSVELSDALL